MEACILDPSIESDNEQWKQRNGQPIDLESIKSNDNHNIQSTVDDNQKNKNHHRNLRSFVDEEAVEQLRASTTATIDVIQQAHAESQGVLQKMGHAISSLARNTSPRTSSRVSLGGGNNLSNSNSSGLSDISNSSDIAEPLGNVNTTLNQQQQRKDSLNNKNQDGEDWKGIVERGLETAHNETTQIATHAHAMAMLLESLARHYDQCCQAIEIQEELSKRERNTLSGSENEGGAMRMKAMDIMGGGITGDRSYEDELEDLEDLVLVLETDTRELEGVIDELQERYREIAQLATKVREFQTQVSEKVYKKATRRFEKLEKFGKEELPQYLEELQESHERAMPESEEQGRRPNSALIEGQTRRKRMGKARKIRRGETEIRRRKLRMKMKNAAETGGGGEDDFSEIDEDDLDEYENSEEDEEEMENEYYDSDDYDDEMGGTGYHDDFRDIRSNREAQITATSEDSEKKPIGIGVSIREMESLVEYYTLFLVSYQRLVLEIERRREFRDKMQGVINEVTAKVGKLLTEELNTRQDVFNAVADFLPGDLWPGLLDPPPFVEIATSGNWSVPHISNTNISKAKNFLEKMGAMPIQLTPTPTPIILTPEFSGVQRSSGSGGSGSGGGTTSTSSKSNRTIKGKR